MVKFFFKNDKYKTKIYLNIPIDMEKKMANQLANFRYFNLKTNTIGCHYFCHKKSLKIKQNLLLI